MAGTVTVTESRDLDGESKDIMRTLACVADAADGSVPTTTIKGLNGLRLTELMTTPGTGGAAPSAYTVTVKDEDGGTLLETSNRSTTAKEYVGGHESLGYYPKIEGDITVEVSDLGNSNETTVKLKFEIGVI